MSLDPVGRRIAKTPMRRFSEALAHPTPKAVLAWSFLLVVVGSVFAASEDSKPVRIGVLAKRGTQQCLEQWGPTAEYLTTQIPGYRFVITPLDHDEVRPTVERGEVDFILANPSLYVELEQSCGASRIVTLKNTCPSGPSTFYAGVIFRTVARTDIRRLPDLKGKRFMAVEEESFGGWQMAWRELREQGVDPRRDFRELRFGGTHDAVVYAVRDGEVDAGTVRTDTLERMAAEGKIRLEDFHALHEHGGGEPRLSFLHSTRAYPEWPLAKLRETRDELAQEVAVALMRMSPETPAAKAAQCAGWVIPQNYQPVHECLKELQIGPYQDYGRVTLGAVVRRYWPWLVGTVVFLAIAGVVSVCVTRLNRALRYALSGYQKEVADRKRAEEALRETRDYLENLLSHANAPIIVWDPTSKITRFNHAFERLTGYLSEEVAGHPLCLLLPQASRDQSLREIELALNGERWESVEIPILRKDGDVRIVLWNSANIYAKDGKTPLATIAQGQDITDRKRAEKALRKSEQLRAESEKLASIGRLAAGVAHEINNPLTGVLTFAHLLREKDNLDEQDRQDLDLVIHETKRAAEIVRSLLDFARERPVVKQPLNVNDVIRQTLRLLGNRKAFQQITVREDFQDDLPAVDGDMNQLQQVLLNLLLNACEAMPNGGTLTISTRSRDGMVLVKLADTGCGIKQAHLEQIFEPFFSTKPIGTGTGLGLSVSYGIIRQHGGDLQVESREGEGSTFTILLPSAEQRPPDGPDGQAD